LSDDSSKQGVPTPPDAALRVVEEELHLARQQVVTGRVRVRTTTDLVEEIAQACLTHESIEVSRVPVDREVDRAPEIRTENDVTIVPIVEEVLVVEKRLVLKEELHIRRRVEAEAVAVPMQLRKQRATVERLSNQGRIPPEKESDR